jgi:hypothetical protein
MTSILINVWVASMVVFLMSSGVIPNAFNIAFTIFCTPLVGFMLYMLVMIVPRDMWMLFGLMCLFIYNM